VTVFTAVVLATRLAAAPPPTALETFFAALEHAIERSDRRAVAGMIHYPIKVLASGWIVPVNDPDTFVKY